MCLQLYETAINSTLIYIAIMPTECELATTSYAYCSYWALAVAPDLDQKWNKHLRGPYPKCGEIVNKFKLHTFMEQVRRYPSI